MAVTTDIFKIPLTSVEELIELGRLTPPWKQRYARWCFNTDHRLKFYRALTVYRSQNIREDRSLVNWWNVLTARGTKKLWDPVAILIPVLLYRMNELGERWQGAFIPWLPPNDAMMFTASQQSGITPELLKTLTELTMRQRVWDKQIKEAVRPALFNLGWIVALVVGVGLFYFPALKKALPHMQVTGSAATLAGLSDFVINYGLFIGLAVIAVPFLVKRMLTHLTGSFRAQLDMLPGFSLYRQSTGMTFLLGLSAVLETGVKFEEAIFILKTSASPYVNERLEALLAFDNLKPADAMAATGYRWPDEETLELLHLYMETNDPHTGIRILVNDWFDQAGEKYAAIGRMTSTVGQLLTWGLVGWLYLVSNDIITASTNMSHH